MSVKLILRISAADVLKSSSLFNIHLLISVLGGWPILDREKISVFDWKSYTYNFLENGILPNHLLSFLVKEKSGVYSFQVFGYSLHILSLNTLTFYSTKKVFDDRKLFIGFLSKIIIAREHSSFRMAK